MTTYSRNDFKPPNLNTALGSNFRTAGNSSSGIVSGQIPVMKPWENQPAIYQVDTTYGSNFSTDHGENDRKRQKEKMIMNKFRNSVEPFLSSQPTFSKQYNTGRSHIDNRIHEMLTNHTVNSPKLWNPNINAELDFNKKDFKFKSGQITPPQLQREKKDKRNAEIKMRQIRNGECIPNIDQLQLYGRRKPKSKFEQAGLWISKTDIVEEKPGKRYLL